MKQYFSFSLFKDAMKQLRVHGFVFLIIVSFPVLFGGMFLDTNNFDIPISYLSVLSFPVIAPIMTFYLFGFLNKRNSSDFYHGIPKSRTCVYITYVSAIMSWITIILLGSTILGGILCLLTRRMVTIQELDIYHSASQVIKYEIAYKETFVLLFSLLLCSLLVIAVITIGMSLSGTSFTGITIAGMILFLPSVLKLFIDMLIEHVAPYVNTEHFFFLFTPVPNNLVASVIASIFGVGGYWEFYDIFTDGYKIIYTFILTILYLTAGGYLFNKRKSECAGFSTIYPIVQTTIRCLCSITFSLIPLSMLFDKLLRPRSYVDVSGIIMLYLISIIIYFMFELISTKRAKNLLKAIPGLLIVAASNIALCAIILTVASFASKFQPEPDEIEYVKIDFELDNLDHMYQNEYLDKLASEYKIEDKEIRELISKRLKTTIEDTQKYEGPYDYSYSSSYQQSFSFAICVDGTITYRNIKLSSSDKARFLQLLRYNTELFPTFFALPQATEADLSMGNIHSSALSAKERMEIYQTLMEEINALPDSKIKEAVLLGNYHYSSRIYDYLAEEHQNMEFFSLEQSIRYKRKNYTCDFPITPLTPKTYSLVLKYLTEHFTTYIQTPHAFSDEHIYEMSIRSSIFEREQYLSSGELYFDEFFEIAKNCSGVPTINDEFYLIKDYTNLNQYIGALNSSKELDAFIEKLRYRDE